jgi:DNA-3-methyladenine glycosylase I
MDRRRCAWAEGDPLTMRYHDEEWGVPVFDDVRLFEFLVLESAQAGLAWITILRKREHYRRLYRGFQPSVVAAFGEAEMEALLQDAGIVRNRRKVASSVNNAKRFLEVQEEFGSFANYLWSSVDGRPLVTDARELSEVPATTELSDGVSSDLRRRGFSFVGSTILYAYLQAVGVVNDHVVGCFRRDEIIRGYDALEG